MGPTIHNEGPTTGVGGEGPTGVPLDRVIEEMGTKRMSSSRAYSYNGHHSLKGKRRSKIRGPHDT